MRVRGVLDQQFNNDLHAQLAGLFDKGDDIGQLSEAGIHLEMVADVIAFIEKGREVKRGDPDNRRPHAANVPQLGRYPGDVPAAIAVQIIKECGINLVNNGPCMPVRHRAPQ